MDFVSGRDCDGLSKERIGMDRLSDFNSSCRSGVAVVIGCFTRLATIIGFIIAAVIIFILWLLDLFFKPWFEGETNVARRNR